MSGKAYALTLTPAQKDALRVLRHFRIEGYHSNGTLTVRGADGRYAMTRGGLLSRLGTR